MTTEPYLFVGGPLHGEIHMHDGSVITVVGAEQRDASQALDGSSLSQYVAIPDRGHVYQSRSLDMAGPDGAGWLRVMLCGLVDGYFPLRTIHAAALALNLPVKASP